MTEDSRPTATASPMPSPAGRPPEPQPPRPPGTVYLIGGGPGDPGLITVRGAERLRRAEVVFYDYLCNERLLDGVPADAERICLGRHGVGKIWTQAEINAAMVRAAQAGRTVARLKGGDPAIFGRLADETMALAEAGIPFEVVPGVTAASAASAYSTIPITDKSRASAVAFITGQEAFAKTESGLDFPALAAFPGTLAVYMGVTTVAAWTTALIQAGKPPETPVAIVRHVSLPTQTTIRCRLDEVAANLTPASRHRPPVLVLIGDVTGPPRTLGWFESRPLFGRTVLVTRAEAQAADWADRLTDLGATALCQPTITTTHRPLDAAIESALAALPTTDWLVFASRNGVEGFFTALKASGRDLRALGSVRLAVVGPGTAETLASWHLTPDAIPETTYSADGLADVLAPRVAGKRVRLVQANRSRLTLAERLTAAGAIVDAVVVYDSADVATPDPAVADALEAEAVDDVLVTSPAIAASLVRLFGSRLASARLVAISPLTASTLTDQGYPVAAVATEACWEGLVAALQSLGPRRNPPVLPPS